MEQWSNEVTSGRLPTKHIVSDDSASGKSMSAGSTSEFGHESLTNIIEVFRSELNRREEMEKKRKNS